MTDLNVLFPGRDVTINGETLHIRPFYFGELPKASAILIPAATAIAASGFISLSQGTEGEVKMQMALPDDWPVRLMMLMSEAGEQIMQLSAFVTKKPREWFDTVAPDDGIALVKAILEENKDFFTKKILPLFQNSPITSNDGQNSTAESETPSANTTGPTLSPGSEATAIPG